MKRFLLSSVIALGLMSTAAVANTATVVSALIPFDFIANGMELPAGRYDIQIRLNSIRLISEDGQKSINVPATQVRFSRTHGKTEVLMKREGRRMHLAGVRDSDSNLLRIVGPGF